MVGNNHKEIDSGVVERKGPIDEYFSPDGS
jgi:hypothetical protein